MTIKQVICCTMPSCQVILEKGKAIQFVAGEYHTDIESEVKELDEMIAAGHPHLFRNPAKLEIDSDEVDPIEVIKQKAIADYIAVQKAREGADFGTTEVQKEATGIVTTKKLIAGSVASSDSSKK